ncbi:MAG: hypothetical protein GW839_07715 [Flavobacteriales bacterium]|nr:hypothetical protein [Flavobacteriia bacterium]NCP07111.1 hypothetical protein [Flavobacteriales bacterium]PIV93999.1 MAG: hypothetical protein COW44_06490 [Flavobacteriaceae bacterium CG17_big_fil_post_rev_8_21_14_2_50_33_15]PIY12411.1 MAG: hypothetical protein COZ17_03640 [Flavobacteriaceae bacterium CG_4_10_14_3_um_filter_33_47]PJB20317.1 MAG: hypothetical protein CO117_01405 [Flavobacteriaceae bacterium CG_4_9_14_3_um_filter_33_16]
MKKIALIMLFCLATVLTKAQNDFDVFLAAGIEDAQRFADDYLAPGTNGLMYSMNAGWFNTADAKPLGGFEITVLVNAATIGSDDKSFLMNTDLYNNVDFVQGGNSQMVANALGENNPDIDVVLTFDDPIFGQQTEQVTLPNGIGNTNISVLPTAFIQGALGLSKGLEVKARFVPKIDTDDVSLNMYGAGLQAEFTKWLPADKLLPVAISGLIAYTHLDGSYDLTDSSGVSGENQRLETSIDTWLFQLIASTKLPVINFYGGLGFISGKSDSDLLGTFRVSNGLITSDNIVDPFSVSSEISSVRGTIGTKLKLGFFRLNAEYHLAEFNAFSVGINFGFR